MPARILVLEDDPASRELLIYLFSAAGYETFAAPDGVMGVRMALDLNPDLLLCDLQMPAMNGYEVLRSLYQAPTWRRVPIIAVTAFSMQGDRETALAAGFDGYFAKPIMPEQFVRQVEAFLPGNLIVQRAADF